MLGLGTSYVRGPFFFYTFGDMFLIINLVPYAMMIGYEYFPEDDNLQFNEFVVYLFFFAVSYRWRNDGQEIQNLRL